jgi:hypothetical protein
MLFSKHIEELDRTPWKLRGALFELQTVRAVALDGGAPVADVADVVTKDAAAIPVPARVRWAG